MSLLLVVCGSSVLTLSACYYVPIGTLRVVRPGPGIQASPTPFPSAVPVRIDLQGTLVSIEASGSVEGLPLSGDPVRLEGER